MIPLADVQAAQAVLQAHLWRTPLLPSEALTRVSGSPVYLKLECWQQTGSFKVRGALYKLSTLPPPERTRPIVTASAGNHGLGLAYAARVLGTAPVTVFVPTNVSRAKLDRLAAAGCQIQMAGADYDATHALAEAYAQEHNALYVSAYDDPAVIAGQGTVGLEILDELPEADAMLVPVGGGGLVAGIASVARARRPGIRIIGVQPEASPSAFLSLRDGRAYETYPAAPTICDGLAGGFGRVPFELAAHLIDEILVVSETSVRQAVGWLLANEQILVEGSGAIAIAGLLSGQLRLPGRRLVAVLTGRNIDASLVKELLLEYGQS